MPFGPTAVLPEAHASDSKLRQERDAKDERKATKEEQLAAKNQVMFQHTGRSSYASNSCSSERLSGQPVNRTASISQSLYGQSTLSIASLST